MALQASTSSAHHVHPGPAAAGGAGPSSSHGRQAGHHHSHKLHSGHSHRSLEPAHAHRRLTVFHGLRAPPIELLPYLERVAKYTKCSPVCFVMALSYMDQLAVVGAWARQHDVAPSLPACSAAQRSAGPRSSFV